MAATFISFDTKPKKAEETQPKPESSAILRLKSASRATKSVSWDKSVVTPRRNSVNSPRPSQPAKRVVCNSTDTDMTSQSSLTKSPLTKGSVKKESSDSCFAKPLVSRIALLPSSTLQKTSDSDANVLITDDGVSINIAASQKILLKSDNVASPCTSRIPKSHGRVVGKEGGKDDDIGKKSDTQVNVVSSIEVNVNSSHSGQSSQSLKSSDSIDFKGTPLMTQTSARRGAQRVPVSASTAQKYSRGGVNVVSTLIEVTGSPARMGAKRVLVESARKLLMPPGSPRGKGKLDILGAAVGKGVPKSDDTPNVMRAMRIPSDTPMDRGGIEVSGTATRKVSNSDSTPSLMRAMKIPSETPLHKESFEVPGNATRKLIPESGATPSVFRAMRIPADTPHGKAGLEIPGTASRKPANSDATPKPIGPMRIPASSVKKSGRSICQLDTTPLKGMQSVGGSSLKPSMTFSINTKQSVTNSSVKSNPYSLGAGENSPMLKDMLDGEFSRGAQRILRSSVKQNSSAASEVLRRVPVEKKFLLGAKSASKSNFSARQVTSGSVVGDDISTKGNQAPRGDDQSSKFLDKTVASLATCSGQIQGRRRSVSESGASASNLSLDRDILSRVIDFDDDDPRAASESIYGSPMTRSASNDLKPLLTTSVAASASFTSLESNSSLKPHHKVSNMADGNNKENKTVKSRGMKLGKEDLSNNSVYQKQAGRLVGTRKQDRFSPVIRSPLSVLNRNQRRRSRSLDAALKEEIMLRSPLISKAKSSYSNFKVEKNSFMEDLEGDKENMCDSYYLSPYSTNLLYHNGSDNKVSVNKISQSVDRGLNAQSGLSKNLIKFYVDNDDDLGSDNDFDISYGQIMDRMDQQFKMLDKKAEVMFSNLETIEKLQEVGSENIEICDSGLKAEEQELHEGISQVQEEEQFTDENVSPVKTEQELNEELFGVKVEKHVKDEIITEVGLTEQVFNENLSSVKLEQNATDEIISEIKSMRQFTDEFTCKIKLTEHVSDEYKSQCNIMEHFSDENVSSAKLDKNVTVKQISFAQLLEHAAVSVDKDSISLVGDSTLHNGMGYRSKVENYFSSLCRAQVCEDGVRLCYAGVENKESEMHFKPIHRPAADRVVLKDITGEIVEEDSLADDAFFIVDDDGEMGELIDGFMTKSSEENTGSKTEYIAVTLDMEQAGGHRFCDQSSLMMPLGIETDVRPFFQHPGVTTNNDEVFAECVRNENWNEAMLNDLSTDKENIAPVSYHMNKTGLLCMDVGSSKNSMASVSNCMKALSSSANSENHIGTVWRTSTENFSSTSALSVSDVINSQISTTTLTKFAPEELCESNDTICCSKANVSTSVSTDGSHISKPDSYVALSSFSSETMEDSNGLIKHNGILTFSANTASLNPESVALRCSSLSSVAVSDDGTFLHDSVAALCGDTLLDISDNLTNSPVSSSKSSSADCSSEFIGYSSYSFSEGLKHEQRLKNPICAQLDAAVAHGESDIANNDEAYLID